jgi:hypothetical protein
MREPYRRGSMFKGLRRFKVQGAGLGKNVQDVQAVKNWTPFNAFNRSPSTWLRTGAPFNTFKTSRRFTAPRDVLDKLFLPALESISGNKEGLARG